MFKLTPTNTNSQRSTPISMRGRSSMNQSNGEILMSEYFNLPMISTKSTNENYKTNVYKPNTISMIEDYNENYIQRQKEKNNTPKSELIDQGENDFQTTNFDYLEKYYQNKAITQQRCPRIRVYTKPGQEQKKEERFSSLQQKNAQNFNQLSDSDQNSQIWEFKTNKFDQKYISNYDQSNNILPVLSLKLTKQKTVEMKKPYINTDNLRRKLKSVFLVVFSTMVLTKNYRIHKKAEKQTIHLLNQKLSSCQKLINQNGVRQIEEQQQQFVQIISNKVIHYLKSQTYIDECNQNNELFNPQQSQDQKKIRVQNFSKLIYQNLELLTRDSNFPELLKCQLITSLYKTSKQQTSFFVGERCHFYQANKINISREQKLAIAMEFLLFQIIIPNLLQLVNKLPNYSLNYKVQTQKIILIIASLLHQQFVNRFKNMRKVRNPNGYMVNKKLSIQYLEDGLFCNEITIGQQTGDNNEVLQGLVEQEQLQQIENSKPLWKQQLDTIFEKILSNVQTLINF